MTRLARAIESLSGRDAEQLRLAEEVESVRPTGARILYAICKRFVDGVNSKLSEAAVTLDPPEWSDEQYSDSAPNVIQINLRGRLLVISFKPTEHLQSTDDFKKPYTLEGYVHSFNQELLEQNEVDEKHIYFCRNGKGGSWYFVDRRLYRTGLFNLDFLIREMERLL